MKVLMQKSGRGFFSNKKWDDLCSAIKYFLEKNNIAGYDGIIKIIFQQDVIDHDICGGATHGITKVAVKTYYKKITQFTINICANQTFGNVLNTLFHELTHVKQFCKSDLILAPTGYLWKGVFYKEEVKSFNEYLDLPWEIEARSLASAIHIEWSARTPDTWHKKFSTWCKKLLTSLF